MSNVSGFRSQILYCGTYLCPSITVTSTSSILYCKERFLQSPQMRSSLFSWLFFLAIYSLFFSFSLFEATGQCLGNQQTLLLQLKNNISVSDTSTKLVTWNRRVDCCSWGGVTCRDGHVIGLDLSNELISSEYDNLSILFSLSRLESLNLAYYDLLLEGIPAEIGKLINLMYLNISHANCYGKIPLAISHLTRLVVLDLSFNGFLGLETPNLNLIFQNISELTELYLDGVAISVQDNKWCQVLSSSLPNLKVLSLSSCGLSGPIDSSLRNLEFLSVIHLSSNNFSTPIPEFFADFKNLTSLNLASCNLSGKFPNKIFQVSTLQELDLSNNSLLQVSLPEFYPNESLRTIKLRHTNCSRSLPTSINNLKMLSMINLQKCNFIGPIPTFNMVENLIEIQLDGNNLSGQITSIRWENFLNLKVLSLSFNSLDGNIPISLFSLPSLQELILSNNQFSGQIIEFFNGSSSLEKLDLSGNILDGPLPISIFTLRGLKWLSFSSNAFCGTLSLGMTQSRNLSHFKQSNLSYLDLSENQIEGEIPNWIPNLTFLKHLNLSHNFLKTLEGTFTSNNLAIIDVHSNQLRGQLPIFPNVQYLDLSRNNFSSTMLTNIASAFFVSLSSNMLYGSIPKSICDATNLQVLDLSNNSFSGTISQCLIKLSNTLRVLSLGSNKLNGTIFDMFPNDCRLQTLTLNENQLKGQLPKSLVNCSMMEVLDVGKNNIEGTFPFHLKNISTIRVLVLGSNKFYGHIPYFGHDANWSMLQILDLSSNNFIGSLPLVTFSTLRAMINENKVKSKLEYLRIQNFEIYYSVHVHPHIPSIYSTLDPTMSSHLDNPHASYRQHALYNRHASYNYQNVVTLTIKGSVLKLQKILTIFTIIDFSCNNFDGPIPKEIGELKMLYALNLSHNAFRGPIPPSLGKLTHLESLDLSNNNLIGKIPLQLADGLIFLSVLNLSFNQLEGQIPKSKQFGTFDNTSFEGNIALCGLPLSLECIDKEPQLLPPTHEESHLNSKTSIDWNYISVELGFIFGLGIVILPLMFWKKWRVKYYQCVDNILFEIFPQLY